MNLLEAEGLIADWERRITNLVIGPPVIIFCIDSISNTHPWMDEIEKVNWIREGF